MAMNAAAQSLIALITGANLRFVIPVYQRPYSWDEEQCEQLWDDILSVGRRPDDRHFTGSVVWVQDGTMSASGVTPLLLIDGQQRITTVTLLIAALADYSRSHPDAQLRFSHAEIMGRGYLRDEYKSGEERYKLTLSQGDRATLVFILENLADPKAPVVEESSRLIENYAYFRRRIEALEDPNLVWDGIQRLDVVSISLDAGRDNPQLIFESMNSTGKDLSSADLIRNYVLMGLPRKEQDRLYRNHWRRIEEALGADSYDEVFDEFVRNYLTVLYAPEPLARRDVYPIFKRHVRDQGYDKDGRISELLEELQSFAGYYAAITAGKETEPRLKAAFDSLARLSVSVVNPLLLSLYDDYASDAFGLNDFVTMVRLLESYILRRAVCDAPTNSLNKFFPSVIAKLNRVQSAGGNYREAFESYLLLEAGTARRFPSDGEFEQALVTRDAYHFRRAFYLLEGLENHHHPKDPLPIWSGTYTIEHVMPQNALAHEEWRAALGEGADERFEPLLNNLGNLTLTAYNAELSDGTFEQKKSRVTGGFENEYLVISKDVHDADEWTPAQIEARGRSLAQTALARWPFLGVAQEAASAYEAKPEKNPQSKARAGFKILFDVGLFAAGEKLVPVADKFDTVAEVTDQGRIRLPNGEEFNSPSLAAVRVVALAGGAGSRNGWTFWRLGNDGPAIDEVRQKYLDGALDGDGAEALRHRFRSMYWSDFYELASESDAFVEAFGDPSERAQNRDYWASFKAGTTRYHFDASALMKDGYVAASIWFRDRDAYQCFYANRNRLGEFADASDVAVEWDGLEEDKNTRSLVVKRYTDFQNDEWRELYAWQIKWLLALRRFVLAVDGGAE